MSGTVLYDGECSFCSSQVNFIRKHDRQGRFRFVALKSEEGRSLLRDAGLPDTEPDTVVYETRGGIRVRSSAVLDILGDLGGGWRLFRIMKVIPAGIRDFFYRIVARNRHHLAHGNGSQHP